MHSRTGQPRKQHEIAPAAVRSSFHRSRSTARASFATVQVTGSVASGASNATCRFALCASIPT